MLKLILLVLISGLVFLYFLYNLYMLAVKKKANYRMPLILSFLVAMGLAGYTIYQAVRKSYHTIKKADQWLVDGATDAGKLAGSATAAFGSSAVEGAGTVLNRKLVLSPAIRELGLQVGTVRPLGHDSLECYWIFKKNIDTEIRIRILDQQAQELGRVTRHLTGTAGNARVDSLKLDAALHLEDADRILIENSE